MRNLTYIQEPISIPDSDLQIVALSEKDEYAYALRKKDVTMYPPDDLEKCFPLLSYLVRLAESGEDVPEFEDVTEATKKARDWVKQQGKL